jgi:hypothetical protein
VRGEAAKRTAQTVNVFRVNVGAQFTSLLMNSNINMLAQQILIMVAAALQKQNEMY